MNGDPRLKPQGYFDQESDFERAEYLERYAEYRSERRRDDDLVDGKTGSDIDKFLDGKIEE
jgi:hypothetical protein